MILLCSNNDHKIENTKKLPIILNIDYKTIYFSLSFLNAELLLLKMIIKNINMLSQKIKY